MEDRKAQDIFQVVGDSLQVHTPDIVALHLHQVGEKELPQLWVLPQKGNALVGNTLISESNAPSGCAGTRRCPLQPTPHASQAPCAKSPSALAAQLPRPAPS